eukprot:2588847-Pleurochrysis_carterae.AAC.1
MSCRLFAQSQSCQDSVFHRVSGIKMLIAGIIRRRAGILSHVAATRQALRCRVHQDVSSANGCARS